MPRRNWLSFGPGAASASWLLEELRDEDRWGQQFAESQDSLDKLAAEVREEIAAGRATDLDPEKL